MRGDAMTKQMTIRVDPKLLDAIERAAAEDRRPVGNLVRIPCSIAICIEQA
jgi:hypothetical protein